MNEDEVLGGVLRGSQGRGWERGRQWGPVGVLVATAMPGRLRKVRVQDVATQACPEVQLLFRKF